MIHRQTSPVGDIGHATAIDRSPALTEIVPAPSGGRVYQHVIRPGIADVTPTRRARLDAIARWLQDVAYLDLVDAGFEGRAAWIVRRTRIRVEAFPRFGEHVSLRTFCSGIGRFSAERRTSIEGERGRVEAVALWVCLENETGRPFRVDQEFVAAYSESAAGRGANVRLRHPEPPSEADREKWTFRAADVDIAGHVNNSHYWSPVEERLAQRDQEPDRIDAEVEHRAPAGAGEAVLLRAGSSIWVVDPEGEVHASILIADPG